MKKQFVFLGVLAIALIVVGCPPGGSEGTTGGTKVSALALTALVTAPAANAAPVTTPIAETQYTGTVAWQKSDDTAFTGPTFEASTVYKALVTLNTRSGYTFTGLTANSFTYTGLSPVTNVESANRATIIITFPATATGDAPVSGSALVLDTLVIAPVTGATPVTTPIAATQYTGTVAWQTEGGAAYSDPFVEGAVYRALVTLSAKPGYTFTGVAANSFTYTGATAVVNAADSGTVTITFAATAEAHLDTVVHLLSLDNRVTAPVKYAVPVTTAIDTAQYTGTVGWYTGGGDPFEGAVFAASTVYKAVVTLSAAAGYTFTGVAADSFTYTGATAANAADSGVITITFAATAADTTVDAPLP